MRNFKLAVQVKFEGFGKLRLAGIKHTRHDWIYLDSDEECTSEAERKLERLSTLRILKRRIIHKAEYLRDNLYGLGWYPDYRQPQLFQRGKMTYPAEELVHEGYRLDGRLGYMKCDICRNPLDFVRGFDIAIFKPRRRRTCAKGRSGGVFIGLGHGIAHFIQIYF